MMKLLFKMSTQLLYGYNNNSNQSEKTCRHKRNKMRVAGKTSKAITKIGTQTCSRLFTSRPGNVNLK